MRKTILLALPVFVILSLLAYVFFNRDTSSIEKNTIANPIAETPDIIFPVKVAKAEQGDLILWISSGGLALPAKEVEIISQISGQVLALHAHNGKLVHQGDLLLQLDETASRINLTEAENNLLSARIEYNFIKLGLSSGSERPERVKAELDSLRARYQQALTERQRGLLEEESFGRIKRNYEALLTYSDFNRDDVIANKCGLNRALVEYERAKLNLSYCQIRAPFTGYVADCQLNPGGGFLSTGFKCMKLVDLATLRIMAKVTETQIGKIKIGNQAEAKFVAFPSEIFQGIVVEINPYIDLEKRTGQVAVEVRNPDGRIKPGMYGTVRIQGDVVRNAILVPRSALVMRDNRPVVFCAKGTLAKWIYVQLGAENEDYYQITQGIAAGDSVIVEGNYNLAHDAKIKILE